jgi:surfeit locus 1 family protein
MGTVRCDRLIDWCGTVMGLCTVVLGLFLGVWQLQRADEKRMLLQQAHQQQMRPPVLWKTGDKQPSAYASLRVQGHFLPNRILLDNQHHRHRFGYDVLSLFQLESGGILLIDHGFVPGAVDRKTYPQVDFPTDTQTLTGSAYYPNPHPWVLGPLLEKKDANLWLVEALDLKMMGETLHQALYPFIIRLDKASLHGFVRSWPIISMKPERHVAYALQWFLLSVVALIFAWNHRPGSVKKC